jgi:hypothetical protein
MWVDFTNLRTEVYAADSRIPTVSFGSPVEDAERRDFTVNALFFNVTDNAIEDFTGHGLEDLRTGTLRTPLDPKVTFRDDPLRVLRALRFSARFGFVMVDELRSAASDPAILECLASKVSRERIGNEVQLMLGGPRPIASARVLHAFRLLDAVLAPASVQQAHAPAPVPASDPSAVEPSPHPHAHPLHPVAHTPLQSHSHTGPLGYVGDHVGGGAALLGAPGSIFGHLDVPFVYGGPPCVPAGLAYLDPERRSALLSDVFFQAATDESAAAQRRALLLALFPGALPGCLNNALALPAGAPWQPVGRRLVEALDWVCKHMPTVDPQQWHAAVAPREDLSAPPAAAPSSAPVDASSALPEHVEAWPDHAQLSAVPLSAEHKRILMYAALTSPFGTLGFFTKKAKQETYISHIICTHSLKRKATEADETHRVIDSAAIFRQLAASERPSRLDLGLLLRYKAKELWPLALYLSAASQIATLVFRAEMASSLSAGGAPLWTPDAVISDASLQHNHLLQASHNVLNAHLNLVALAKQWGIDGCWTWKAILNGKQIMDNTGIKPGPSMGRIVDEMNKWQLLNPQGSESEAVAYLKSLGPFSSAATTR